ncbi:hypothetical protein CEXT_417501 [Caerostris extrusa]|uniref:Uncharacterized protein n=1 Tax=Caerostris extrusa TaxID=172846 RepID=A0AAV4VNS6_CAEEX|nr:hypothetical protein CEXT_417501 [Caerostris extrusa]
MPEHEPHRLDAGQAKRVWYQLLPAGLMLMHNARIPWSMRSIWRRIKNDEFRDASVTRLFIPDCLLGGRFDKQRQPPRPTPSIMCGWMLEKFSFLGLWVFDKNEPGLRIPPGEGG